MKDLITVKRKTNVLKTAFMTKQVSASLQCKLPLKYKNPGCPTITCMIGFIQIERALLDLGASVNLLPLLSLFVVRARRVEAHIHDTTIG